MPHVSLRKVDDKILADILKQLTFVITDGRFPRTRRRTILLELLTPTEKLMLAKRLAAIALLSRNVSMYRTSKTLKLSMTTLSKLEKQMDRKKYSGIVSAFKRQKEDFWDILEELILAGMPKQGKGRWEWLDRLD